MPFFFCRRSQAVLTKCLPKKEEHIILVNMSPIQKELYNGFVEGLLGSVGHVNPIKGFHTCTKVSKFLAQSNLHFIYFYFIFILPAFLDTGLPRGNRHERASGPKQGAIPTQSHNP